MTLVEIMIVIAIIGGLMAILGQSVIGRFSKSQVSQAKIQIRELGKGLELYYTDCGSYPNSLEDLVEAPDNCANWGPDPYIKKVPVDPWGSDYIYELDGSDYVLISMGADKEEGGTGKDKDISSADL